ncbi:MAG TPA: hypothetical protein VGK73_16050 [Polyangiaceae bacterium]
MKPISSTGVSYDMAVAKQILEGTRKEGEQALALIETAATAPAPVAGTQPSVGRMIDIKA